MRAIQIGLTLFILLGLIGPAYGGSGIIMEPFKPVKIDFSTIEKFKPAAPETGASKMNKAGPVNSPDPYFTLRICDAEIYRDALDNTLAYYKPNLKVGNRYSDTSLVGLSSAELAAVLDGFFIHCQLLLYDPTRRSLRAQATVSAIATLWGVALDPKAFSNLPWSITKGRSNW